MYGNTQLVLPGKEKGFSKTQMGDSRQGQTVKEGQVIADCCSTGYSTGPHLHFEMIQNGVRVDALNFFK